MEEKYKAIAEEFFRGVYGGDASVVDSLAAEDIVSSYPIFKKLFDSPALRGREAVKKFAIRFGQRWKEAEVTVHEVIKEDNKVVLFWSFRARNVGSETPDDETMNQQHSWGGITLFLFDDIGKIIAEIGEESVPGPFSRYKSIIG